MSGASKLKFRQVDHPPPPRGDLRSLAILERLKVLQNYSQVGEEFQVSRQRVHQVAVHFGYRLYRIVRAEEANKFLEPYAKKIRDSSKPCLANCGNQMPRSRRGNYCSACVEKMLALTAVRSRLRQMVETKKNPRFFSIQAMSLIKRFKIRPEEV